MPKWLMVLCCVFHVSQAMAADPLAAHIPDAQTLGKGSFHYLFMHIYDAELSAPAGHFDKTRPFALSLTYQRSLAGEDIAEESIRQMRRQGWKDEAQLSRWHEQMRAIFPDVKKGDTLIGLHDKGMTVFYKDGVNIGEIKDPAFKDAFFDIWLGERSTEPKLRKQLLGGAHE